MGLRIAAFDLNLHCLQKYRNFMKKNTTLSTSKYLSYKSRVNSHTDHSIHIVELRSKMVVLKNVRYVYFENLTVIYQIFVQLLRCVLYLNVQGKKCDWAKVQHAEVQIRLRTCLLLTNHVCLGDLCFVTVTEDLCLAEKRVDLKYHWHTSEHKSSFAGFGLIWNHRHHENKNVCTLQYSPLVKQAYTLNRSLDPRLELVCFKTRASDALSSLRKCAGSSGHPKFTSALRHFIS